MARKPTGKRITAADGTVQVVSKNANGDGSIYESGGRWFATYYDLAGKRRRVSAATRPLVRDRLEAKLAEIQEAASRSTAPLGDAPTVADLVEYWLKHGMDVRPNTAVSYANQCSKIVDIIGDVPLDSFTKDTVVGMFAALRASDLNSPP